MLLIYASLSNSQLTQGSLGIKFLDLNSVKATLPTAVTHAAAPTTKRAPFRPRFFGPRFKKRGPKHPTAPFFKNGA